jgi:hypothetical protein
MSTEEFPDAYEQQKEEDDLSQYYGEPVRVVYLNPEELALLKCFWFVVINPTQKSTSEVAQMLFVNNVRQGYELFGPQSFNIDYVKQRWSILTNEDYSKLFKKLTPQEQMMMEGAATEGGASMPLKNKPLKPVLTQ